MNFTLAQFFNPFAFLVPLLSVAFIVIGIRVVSKIIKSISGSIDEPEEKQQLRWGNNPLDEINRQRFDQNKQKLKKTEVSLFRLADKMKGRITVSDAVIETGIGIKEAEEYLNSLVDGSHVRMEVTDTGSVIYEFPEIISKYEK